MPQRGTKFFDPQTFEGPENRASEIITGDDDFKVKVLTAGTWAVGNYYTCNLPSKLLSFESKFTNFYKAKNANRTLEWQYQHGYVNLSTLFTPQKYLLKVSVA